MSYTRIGNRTINVTKEYCSTFHFWFQNRSSPQAYSIPLKSISSQNSTLKNWVTPRFPSNESPHLLHIILCCIVGTVLKRSRQLYTLTYQSSHDLMENMANDDHHDIQRILTRLHISSSASKNLLRKGATGVFGKVKLSDHHQKR